MADQSHIASIQSYLLPAAMRKLLILPSSRHFCKMYGIVTLALVSKRGRQSYR